MSVKKLNSKNKSLVPFDEKEERNPENKTNKEEENDKDKDELDMSQDFDGALEDLMNEEEEEDEESKRTNKMKKCRKIK